MVPEEQENCIVFGTFPFRGSIMSCRLICEFVGLKYVDALFDPKTWGQFKDKHAANWTFKQIPFFKDGQFILTNMFAISGYLAQKSNRMDLLGNNLQQETTINTFFGNQNLIEQVMSLECQMKFKNLNPAQKQQGRKKYWKQKFEPFFIKFQALASKTWLLSHITIIDFFIYQYYNLLSMIYPQEMQKFSKIARIAKNFGQLEQIKAYEKSQKAITQYCPNRYFQKFKKQCGQFTCSRAKGYCKMVNQC